jgi:hypothetical protein
LGKIKGKKKIVEGKRDNFEERVEKKSEMNLKIEW